MRNINEHKKVHWNRENFAL